MKRLGMLAALLSVSLFLVGCGGTDETKKTDTKTDTKTETDKK